MFIRCAILTSLLAIALVCPSNAQSPSSRQMRIVVPTSTGSGYDFIGRQLANGLQTVLGVPVIVENKVGVLGQIGAQAVISSPPNGNTLLVGGLADFAITPALKPLPYEPMLEFRPVTVAVSFSFVLMARTNLPESTMPDLVSFVRANPGLRSIANPGAGSGQQIAAALLKLATKSDFLDVQYRSAPAVYTDLLGGLVDLTFDNIPVSIAHLEAGRLKAFLITGAERSPLLPLVPTAVELGFKDLTLEAWNGLFVRRDTPDSMVEKLSDATIKVLSDPVTREKLGTAGWRILKLDSAQSEDFIRREQQKWPPLLREAGVRIE